jgi:polysaccharide biosynthesis/export protein
LGTFFRSLISSRCRLALVTALGALALVSPANAAPQSGAAHASVARANALDNSSIAPDMPRRDARYRLCASDVLALTFPLTPEFNETVDIAPDGFVALAGAGSVHLEGLTADEAAAAIRTAYAKVLRDPIVTVELKDFNKPYFIVSGQVNRPGKYDLRGYTSASQAVAEAGGFNESAKHSQVLLFRRVNHDWYQVRSLDLKKILSGRQLNEDAQIEPGDMLYVPQNLISKLRRFIPSSGVGAYYQLHP